MQGNTRTKAQARRIEIIKTELGCECCHIDRQGFFNLDYDPANYEPCDYHHRDDVTPQNHDYGFGLCRWHHVGEEPERAGPTLKQRKAFRARYGSQMDLQHRCDARLALFESTTLGGSS